MTYMTKQFSCRRSIKRSEHNWHTATVPGASDVSMLQSAIHTKQQSVLCRLAYKANLQEDSGSPGQACQHDWWLSEGKDALQFITANMHSLLCVLF